MVLPIVSAASRFISMVLMVASALIAAPIITLIGVNSCGIVGFSQP
jgi:uncharacterized protein (DUF927 family)